MMTLCIRYTLDVSKLAAFEAYARAWQAPQGREKAQGDKPCRARLGSRRNDSITATLACR
jgi:hypothetical protein